MNTSTTTSTPRSWGPRAVAMVAFAVIVAMSIALAARANTTSPGSRPPDRSVADLFAFSDPDTPVGRSSLVRTSTQVRMDLRTVLPSREAATVWWVVFNEPESCSPPACGSDDIFVDGDPAGELNAEQIDRADIVAAYATGAVANRSGRVRFAGSIDEGEQSDTREVVFGSGPALKDARDAEVHLVVRSHGPAQEGLEHEQTGSFAGGCQVDLVPPEAPDAPGECGDVMFAVHAP